MKSSNQFENLTGYERVVRFGVSVGVIVATTHSVLVGTTAFAVVNILAILLSTTAIIGWDPAKALSVRAKRFATQHWDQYHGHRV